MTAEEAKKLKVAEGDIMQVLPEAGTDYDGRVGVVARIESWGAGLTFDRNNGIHPIAWSNMEPTGGRARWDAGGRPIPATVEPPLKHHP